MKHSKIIDNLVSSVEQYAIEALADIMRSLKVDGCEEVELLEPFCLSFYPEFTARAVTFTGEEGNEAFLVKADNDKGLTRDFEAADSGIIPLQDLQVLIQDIERQLTPD